MQSYVEVLINLPKISGTYHYHLPPDLVGSVKPGSLVIVPFGPQRVQGIIVKHIDVPEVAETRPVEDLVEGLPPLTSTQLALAYWLADETLAPLGACIELMLPPGLTQRADTLVRLISAGEIDLAAFSPLEKRLIRLLQKRGDLRGRQIDA